MLEHGNFLLVPSFVVVLVDHFCHAVLWRTIQPASEHRSERNASSLARPIVYSALFLQIFKRELRRQGTPLRALRLFTWL